MLRDFTELRWNGEPDEDNNCHPEESGYQHSEQLLPIAEKFMGFLNAEIVPGLKTFG
jgi:hypothetical protein